MTADGPPRCLWRIRDCALSCRLFPSAGGVRAFAILWRLRGIPAELFFFFFAVLLFGLLFCQCCPTGEKFQLGFSFICAAVCSPEFCPLSENDEKL